MEVMYLVHAIVNVERCFSSCHKGGTKKKILSPHKESNLRPLDAALRCSTTEPQRLYGKQGLL